jgi:hypothetical protein
LHEHFNAIDDAIAYARANIATMPHDVADRVSELLDL